MKSIGWTVPFLAALVLAPAQATAASWLGSDLLNYSILSGTYVSTGDSAKVYGNVLADTYATAGANSSIYGNFQSGTVGTTGANALVEGNFQTILAGTIGAGAIVQGNFQAGLVGSTGAGSLIYGNFVSGLAGSAGANSRIDGNFNAGGAIALDATSSIGGSITGTADTTAMTSAMSGSLVTAKSELLQAKSVLGNLGAGTGMAATMTVDTTLHAGVYSAASWSTTAGTTLFLDGQGKDNQSWVFNITDILATGASTKIELINAGAGSAVFWNTGGYASLGADSSFLGTVLATDYISVGAGANLKDLVGSPCGGLFSSTSYVSIGAGASVGSSGCSAVTSDITTAVPEPESYAMLLAGLGLVGAITRRRSANKA